MTLDTVRQEAGNRFQEAQSFLSSIKSLETARNQHADEINVRKGLFLVLLYGAFEYSLTRTLTEATVLINACRVEYGHMNELLYGLALDPQLASLTAAEARRDSKWQRRTELFRKQACADPVVLLDSAFAPELQNAKANTIQKMFDVFGITQPALYDPRVKQYIDEVVDKRNAVAHGRESASSTGQAYTTVSLQNLNDQLSRQVQYTFSVFENHISTKSFVKTAHLSRY